MTVIGGYLGAGKTSLINRIVQSYDASSMVILVNDFGALNIDAELVELAGGKAYRLQNGCICCNAANGLMTTLLALIKIKPAPEHIIVETSGVANPSRIADIARLSPSLRPGRTVVLIDRSKIEEQIQDPLIGETVKNQIVAGDLLVLNKSDLADNKPCLSVKNAKAEIIEAVNAEIDLDLVFQLPSEQSIQQEQSIKEDHAEKFWQWSFEHEGSLDRQMLKEVVIRFSSILERMKGFIYFSDDPDNLYEAHLSGGRLELHIVSRSGHSRQTCRLVFVAAKKRADQSEITAGLEQALNRAKAGSVH